MSKVGRKDVMGKKINHNCFSINWIKKRQQIANSPITKKRQSESRMSHVLNCFLFNFIKKNLCSKTIMISCFVTLRLIHLNILGTNLVHCSQLFEVGGWHKKSIKVNRTLI